jgi:two-component system response regulator YesN
MYRVLIVDDEEPVLDSYEFMLKTASGFTLACKARSGFEALRAIHELEPELVFMDINIPGINGLEVIADVHKKFPAMVFVLSTAYERFDLAQRAIPLGVFSYLVKPVSKKTFLEVLNRVREQLDGRPVAEKMDAENPQEQFLRKIIWSGMDDAEWKAWREKLALPSDKGIAILLEADQDTEKISKQVAENLSLKYHCIHDTMLNRTLFLVSGDIDREALENRLKAALNKTPSCCCGIGSLRSGTELYVSCNEALAALQWQHLSLASQQNDRQLFTELRHKLAEEIMTLETLPELEKWIKTAFNRILMLNSSNEFPAPLEKAIGYINKHYDGHIQLDDVASAAAVSATYLSRLFSEHLKTTFIEYLTGVRIKQAEKLISESALSIKEIAYAVGYQDPAYFSKIFRKAMGRTPSERRSYK